MALRTLSWGWLGLSLLLVVTDVSSSGSGSDSGRDMSIESLFSFSILFYVCLIILAFVEKKDILLIVYSLALCAACLTTFFIFALSLGFFRDYAKPDSATTLIISLPGSLIAMAIAYKRGEKTV